MLAKSQSFFTLHLVVGAAACTGCMASYRIEPSLSTGGPSMGVETDRSDDPSRASSRPSPVAINQLSGASAARRRWQSMDKEAEPGSYLLRSELAGRRRTSSTESAAPTDKARR